MINSRGFTVLEIVIAVAIIAILASIVLGQALAFRRQAALATESEHLLSLFTQARVETMASRESARYGLYFESGAVTLWRGEAYVAGAADNNVVSLDPQVEIVAIDFPSQQVAFERLTGRANTAGSITLALKSDPSQTRIITVEISGLSSLSPNNES